MDANFFPSETKHIYFYLQYMEVKTCLKKTLPVQ